MRVLGTQRCSPVKWGGGDYEVIESNPEETRKIQLGHPRKRHVPHPISFLCVALGFMLSSPVHTPVECSFLRICVSTCVVTVTFVPRGFGWWVCCVFPEVLGQ